MWTYYSAHNSTLLVEELNHYHSAFWRLLVKSIPELILGVIIIISFLTCSFSMFFSTVRAFVRHSYAHNSTLYFISKIMLLSLITWKIFVISLLVYISCEYWLTTTFLWNSFCTTEAFLLEYCKSKTGHLTGQMTEGMWQAGDLTRQMTGQVTWHGRWWRAYQVAKTGHLKYPRSITWNYHTHIGSHTNRSQHYNEVWN